MSKKTFIYFGLAVAVLAVLIPWLAFRADGDSGRGAEAVPADLKAGQELFQTNCGTCHVLYAAGTEGNFGPDLDVLLAPAGTPSGEGSEKTIEGTATRVLNAIEDGVDGSSVSGRMPPEILGGEQAEEVAEFVAATAGRG